MKNTLLITTLSILILSGCGARQTDPVSTSTDTSTAVVNTGVTIESSKMSDYPSTATGVDTIDLTVSAQTNSNATIQSSGRP